MRGRAEHKNQLLRISSLLSFQYFACPEHIPYSVEGNTLESGVTMRGRAELKNHNLGAYFLKY